MIHFQLVSSTGTKFDDDVYEVLLPTQSGAVAVFQDHMPMISAAQPGVISVRKKIGDKDADMEHFAINGGVLEVDGKVLRFLSDDITAADDVNEKDAQTALARAEELIRTAGSQKDLAEAHRVLHTSRAQLNVARLKRRHHS